MTASAADHRGWSLAQIEARLAAGTAPAVEAATTAAAAVALILRSAAASGEAATIAASADGTASVGAHADVELCLIRRTVRPDDPWSGHMALPGGRRHGDESLLETARRETREEVGIDLHRVSRLIGSLTTVQPMSHAGPQPFLVQPLVFALQQEVSAGVSAEVEETLWVSLAALVRGQHDTQHRLRLGATERLLPAYDVQGRIVWGMTHRLLQQFIERLRHP